MPRQAQKDKSKEGLPSTDKRSPNTPVELDVGDRVLYRVWYTGRHRNGDKKIPQKVGETPDPKMALDIAKTYRRFGEGGDISIDRQVYYMGKPTAREDLDW